jgi:hypothetical protein
MSEPLQKTPNNLANLFSLSPNESSSVLPDAPDQKFNPPQSPVKQHDKLGNLLTVGNVLSRALDTYSTRKMLKEGNHEMFLPNSVVDSTPKMAGYSGGVALADWFAQHELAKHGHPKLAHLLTGLDMGSTLPYAINNLTLGKAKPKFPNIPGRP